MSSRSDSISPGSAWPAEAKRRGLTSLQHALALALLPLGIVLATGTGMAWVHARSVHLDLQRMFEELREASLTRTLLDELRGMEQWVGAAEFPAAAESSLVMGDLRHHLDAARAAFLRFAPPDDPSAAEHTTAETASLERVRSSLDGMAALLAADRPPLALREPLQLAIHGARSLADTVTKEAHEIGDEVDRRTRRLMDVLGVLAVAGLSTLVGLGIWLHRRVLLPLRALQRGTRKLAEGAPLPDLPTDRRDEVGRLSEDFLAMAAQVRRARDELQSKVEERSREVVRTARLAELGTLSAGLAHEINNPLASIATCAEGLLRDHARGGAIDPQRHREYLDIIRKEAMRTRDITQRLLSFARQQPQATGPVQLDAELREVAKMLEHQYEAAGVELAIAVPSPLPSFPGNAAEWRQVAFNLLRNALDASPRGARVEVALRTDGDRLVMECADRGRGLPVADRERIFEPFFTTKAPGQGTGLGLAIAHRIVTGHGGTLRAVDRDGGGASFVIELPRESTD